MLELWYGRVDQLLLTTSICQWDDISKAEYTHLYAALNAVCQLAPSVKLSIRMVTILPVTLCRERAAWRRKPNAGAVTVPPFELSGHHRCRYDILSGHPKRPHRAPALCRLEPVRSLVGTRKRPD